MTANGKTIRILLAEDAAAMRKIETKILASLGYTDVIEAEDGAAAIAILESRNDIDLVISDWNMPNKGGFEFLTWVRASATHRAVPFIMATAQADRAQAGRAFAAGVSGFIPKPFSAEELQKVIETVLGLAPTETQPAAAAGPVVDASGRLTLRLAHIQITDHILLGVLKHMITSGEFTPRHFELETHCMGGWNPVLDALEKGTVDGAFVLAPLAQDLFAAGVPIRMVLLAHRSGSIFVRNRQGAYRLPGIDYFRGKTVLIPHKMSVHHMLVHRFFSRLGLKASLDKGPDVDINLEVVAPVNMPEFLKEHPDVAGFMVAEPIGSKAVAAGIAQRQFLSNEIWKDHPCCIVALRDEIIDQHPDAVFELTDLLVRCGRFVEEHPQSAAEIGVGFLDPQGKLGLQSVVLHRVLTEPEGISTGDLFPVAADLDAMQHYLHDTMGVGRLADMGRFIDTRFAQAACGPAATRPSTLLDTDEHLKALLARGAAPAESAGFVLRESGGMVYFFREGAAG